MIVDAIKGDTMKKIALLLIGFFFQAVHPATAAPLAKTPPRVRLALHAGQKLAPKMKLVGHFLPSPDLMNGLAPMAYLELQLKPNKWLTVGPAIGYDFSARGAIIALRIAPQHKKFWAWGDFEWTAPQNLGYSFLQLQVKALQWLSLGAEYEFWGLMKDPKTWSFGGGPNIIFHLGKKFVFEIAVHFRKGQGQPTAYELITRVHVFLF